MAAARAVADDVVRLYRAFSPGFDLMDVFEAGSRPPMFFMHIPKTAGMSMRLYLDEQYQSDQICPAERWHDLLGQMSPRAFQLVRGHFHYNLRALVSENVRMLTLLRDPIRRTLSALRHLRRDPRFHETYDIARNLPLKGLLRHPAIMSAHRDVQARYLCASMTPEAVATYLERNPTGGAGDLEDPPDLDLAMERLDTIDFVGLTEDLDTLVHGVGHAMRYHPSPWFPRINDDPDPTDPLADLGSEELALLREHNRIDLDLYEYARRMIAWRSRARAVRRMVDHGVYRAPPGSFEVPLDRVVPGSGWYEAEREPGSIWRWTGPDRHFTIDLPLCPNGTYEFSMVFNDPHQNRSAGLAVEINGKPAAFHVTPEDDTLRCDVRIDRGVLRRSDGICGIQIDSGAVERASPPDMRNLGLLVRRLAFRRLDA